MWSGFVWRLYVRCYLTNPFPWPKPIPSWCISMSWKGVELGTLLCLCLVVTRQLWPTTGSQSLAKYKRHWKENHSTILPSWTFKNCTRILLLRGRWVGLNLCQGSRSIPQTSRKGTAVRAQLHPAQTQTKTISYPSNDGVWARWAMAIRFGRHAKVEQMEQGYEVSMYLAKQPGRNPSRTKGPKRWWAPWNA